ncbi:MAG: PLP-dependent cysteine synthase family protein [Candidatus Hodarchaeales archaeon]|jgi:cystathionine beta-synthase
MTLYNNKKLRVYDNIIEAIGWTPLIKMQQLFPSQNIYLKAEFMNPGGSIKDRMGVYMLLEAEKKGILKKADNQVIVEPSSGNTGVGLALACASRGYRLVITMPDKMAPEKAKILEAFGAEVIWCPTAVKPDDPRSYYSMADKIAQEQNGWIPNQYFNQANPESHYQLTGPEIWEQTEGKITHFVAAVGTGGTISGVARYLKEKNSDIKIIGADAEGSIIKEAFENPEHNYNPENIHTYKLEGLGEDFIPDTLDFSFIDEIHTVTDKNGFLTTREVVKREGLLIGGSAGAAVWVAQKIKSELKPNDMVVVIAPDGSRPYLNKIFNDDWMKTNEFL